MYGGKNELRNNVERRAKKVLDAENAQICASNVVEKFTFYSPLRHLVVCSKRHRDVYEKWQPNRSAYKIDFKFTV